MPHVTPTEKARAAVAELTQCHEALIRVYQLTADLEQVPPWRWMKRQSIERQRNDALSAALRALGQD